MFAKQADGTLVVCGMHARGDRVALPSLPKAPRQKAAAGKSGLIAKETPQKKRARASQPASGPGRPSRPQRVSYQSAGGWIWVGNGACCQKPVHVPFAECCDNLATVSVPMACPVMTLAQQQYGHAAWHEYPAESLPACNSPSSDMLAVAEGRLSIPATTGAAVVVVSAAGSSHPGHS